MYCVEVMITVKVIVAVAVAAAVLSTTFAVASQSFVNFLATAQDAELRKNTIGGHTAGYGLQQTSGDILDPVNSYNPAGGQMVIDPDNYLRSFNYGRISKLADGSTVREFTLVADDRQTKEIAPGVFYNVWTFNGTIPGPTLRATEGDLIRINFINNGSKPHSIHTHGIHKAEMDGVFETINPQGKFTYEFYAEAFGVFPYHCHVTPLEEHISHGLYGVYIVDPKIPRPEADEMVMIMNGFDTDFDTENNFYAVNTIPYYYMHHPIEIEEGKLVRVYLVNMLEFDQINNFHLHGNLYHLYRSGTSTAPDEYTDMVTMSQGERAILEFNFKYPGQYMFHAHKTEFAEKGWVGLFLVKDPAETQSDGSSSSSTLLETKTNTKTISGGVGS
jgi:FtsP/CotA-like multicopper oxidase with cupredoxin domain